MSAEQLLQVYPVVFLTPWLSCVEHDLAPDSLSVSLSLCLSVCLSHAGIDTKLTIRLCGFQFSPSGCAGIPSFLIPTFVDSVLGELGYLTKEDIADDLESPLKVKSSLVL